ncbi:MAG: hypothetical protein JNL18_04970 [Planctomycetaceae bacterium]|nr:hypothetical protein [Planctomycetaceae bacterium]
MTQYNPRRRFSFSLRFILVLFTVAAVAMWGYWYGWDLWRWHVDQREFVAAATQLTQGRLISDYWRPKFKHFHPPWWGDGRRHDAKGHVTGHYSIRWPNAQFIVFWKYEGSYASSVEVFQLPPAPVGYLPKTESSKRATAEHEKRSGMLPPDISLEKYLEANPPGDMAYRLDFLEFLRGDRKDNLGFDYKLIHSDPAPVD